MFRFSVKSIVISAIFFAASASAFAQESGSIRGVVVDQSTGEGLIGANVIIGGTTVGAATDIEGKYTIPNAPAGTHTLKASMIGYNAVVVEGVKVNPGATVVANFELLEGAIQTEEVVVTAKALEDTDAGLLKHRKKSVSISDAISAEEFSRAGASNAADAMKKVTGASVVGGKYVYVRGLGDRYNNTQLNGSELPSADPDKKAVNMDLFPSNLLDNIVTVKSFTPDKPGNFAGGLVDINTKAYPENFTFNVSMSGSHNSNVSFNDNFLTYNTTGATDWLGYDDGTRDLPAIFDEADLEIPTPQESRVDHVAADKLDAMSNAWEADWGPVKEQAPLNMSYSLSVGDQIDLGGSPFGYVFSGSYKRSFSHYDDGVNARYNWAETALNPRMDVNDAKSSSETLLGGMANLSYRPHPMHDVSFNVMLTQSGESTARYQKGVYPDQFGDNLFEARTLLYTERGLQSYQLKGKHFFEDLLGISLNWDGALSTSTQNEPNLRFFSNEFDIEDSLYIFSTGVGLPNRIYRNLEEETTGGNFHFTLPFAQWSGLNSKFKFGGHYSEINREFRERRFQYNNGYMNRSQYNAYYETGNPNDFYADSALGIVRRDTNQTSGTIVSRFGTYIEDESVLAHNYDGDQTLAAGYFMFEVPIVERVKFVGGARLESMEMNVVSADTAYDEGNLKNDDWLFSASFVYQMMEDVNLRASYGKTLARPTFRELAPLTTFDFIGDNRFAGNPDLKHTLIENYDLRVEWFERPGEIYAASVFYKDFINPIERAIRPDIDGTIQYQNVDKGMAYGAEFEVRKRLDQVHDYLANFVVNVNFSLVESEVTISEGEIEVALRDDSTFNESKRPLFGQSPYIVNAEFAYDNWETGTYVGVFYNIFGDRLSDVQFGVMPDVFERSRGELDLTVSQRIGYGFKTKLTVKNILDAKMERTIDFNGKEYPFSTYGLGTSVSFGVSYGI
jgi:hypothetical protein